MRKSCLALLTCALVLHINAAQDKKSCIVDYLPCTIDRTAIGLDSNATIDEYIEQLQKTGTLLLLQHKVFLAAYTTYTKPLAELQKNPAFQRAMEKVQTISVPTSTIQNHFKIIIVCCLLNAAPSLPQKLMGKMEKYDFIRRARNKAIIALGILNRSEYVEDHIMLERLGFIEKNILQELDTYFDIQNLLTLDSIYREIIHTLHKEVLHARKIKKFHAHYQYYIDILSDALLQQSTRQKLLFKKQECDGMDLRSLEHVSNRVEIDLLQDTATPSSSAASSEVADSCEQTMPVHPVPLRMDVLKSTYSIESGYIIRHEHLVRICDPENAMAIDLDLSQTGRMVHTYPETPLCDSYALGVSLGFATKFSKKLLKKDPLAIQKYRFSPLVDQYITRLGHEYLLLRNIRTLRECMLIPENMDEFQRLLAGTQHHNDTRAVIHIEFDGHAYLYTTKARIPCTFSYEFDPISNALVSRSMALYPQNLS